MAEDVLGKNNLVKHYNEFRMYSLFLAFYKFLGPLVEEIAYHGVLLGAQELWCLTIVLPLDIWVGRCDSDVVCVSVCQYSGKWSVSTPMMKVSKPTSRELSTTSWQTSWRTLCSALRPAEFGQAK